MRYEGRLPEVHRRKIRGEKCVAVADTGRKETTYIWHTGSRYNMFCKKWNQDSDWGPVHGANAYRREEIIENNNVAAVELSEAPDLVAEKVKSAKTGGDDDCAKRAARKKEEADSSEEKVIFSFLEEKLQDRTMIWNPRIYRELTNEIDYGEEHTATSLAAELDADADAIYHELTRLDEEGKVKKKRDPTVPSGVSWRLNDYLFQHRES